MSKLKKCPFCGGVPIVFESSNGPFAFGKYVVCEKCGCQTLLYTGKDAEEKAIESWNNRKPVEDVLERLKKEENDLFSARKALSLKMYSDFEILEKSKMLLEKELTLFKVIEIIKEELGGMTDV